MRMQAGMGVATAVLLLLAGCDRGGVRPAQACPPDDRPGSQLVVVHVWLDGAADAPDIRVREPACRIAPGARLHWVAVGPRASRLDAIVFKRASASAAGESRLRAGDAGGRRAVPMTARRDLGEATAFEYAVYAGASVLDPVVIIDPALRTR